MEDTVTGQQNEMVLVPRKPTEEMIEAAWAQANEENAEGVWESMIDCWESSFKWRELRKT